MLEKKKFCKYIVLNDLFFNNNKLFNINFGINFCVYLNIYFNINILINKYIKYINIYYYTLFISKYL